MIRPVKLAILSLVTAFLCVPAAYAQTATAPAGSYVPTVAPCYATSGKDSTCIWVDSTHGLPVQAISGGQPMPIAGQTANTVASATNPVPVALYSAGANVLATGSTNADTLATTSGSTNLNMNAIARLWNGTNLSRVYQIDAATNAGTGVSAVAISGGSFTNVTTATTTTIKSGAGIWSKLLVNTPAATTITCYNNTGASGTKIGTWTTIASTQPYSISIDLYFSTGLTCVTANAIDLTFVYR